MGVTIVLETERPRGEATLPLGLDAVVAERETIAEIPGPTPPFTEGLVVSDHVRIVRDVPVFLDRHIALLRDQAQAAGLDATAVEMIAGESFGTALARTIRREVRRRALPERALARLSLRLGRPTVLRLHTRPVAPPPLDGVVLGDADAHRTLTRRPDGTIAGCTNADGIDGRVFFFDGARLCTPALGADPRRGVLRGLLLDSWPGHLAVDSYGLDALDTARSVWTVDAEWGVWPVRRVGAREYPVDVSTDALVRLMRLIWVRDVGYF